MATGTATAGNGEAGDDEADERNSGGRNQDRENQGRGNAEDRAAKEDRDADETPEPRINARQSADYTESAASMVVDPNLGATIRANVAARVAGVEPGNGINGRR
jgi:hypothetical protein